jgi:VanZ family protein
LSAGSPSTLTLRLAWLASALFVCYGTTLPFRFDASVAHARMRTAFVSPNPLLRAAGGERVSIPDVAQNLLLFFPFGLAGALALSHQHPRRRVISVTAAALALSSAVEIAQLFTWDRTSSSSDVLFDTLGALAGAGIAVGLIAPRWSRLRRTAARAYRPALPVLAAAAALVCASAWAPFDFTFDVSTLAAKARAFFAAPWSLPPYANPGFELVGGWLAGTAAFVFFSQWPTRHMRLAAWMSGTLLSLLVEAAAAFVESTNPSLSQLALHIAGVTVGVLLQPGAASRAPWSVLAVAATAAAAGMRFDTGPASIETGSAAAVLRGHVAWTICRYAAAGFLLYRLATQARREPAMDL